ncbi:MAG: hypothetical protein FWH02_06595, partial [Oscillospiraceae bacterium]|nr:hypothetical protein [Oscillospiraceae bacterium]
MPNPVSFEKVRKRRRKIETIKRLSILALIFAVVAGAVALNNLLVQNELSLRISDLLELRGGTGFPADLPGGIVRDIK